MKTIRILRPALLALAATAVAGCVTAPGYGYRSGQGDYYYGQPSVDYRYRGGYGPYHHGYGYPYGYGHYGRSGWSLGVFYGHPYYRYGYGFHHPWYGWPHYGYPYYRRPVVVHPGPGDQREADDRNPPWRDLDRLRELDRTRRMQSQFETAPAPLRPAMVDPRPAAPRSTARSNSRTRVLIQRSQEAQLERERDKD
jgi:hypothetical protein